MIQEIIDYLKGPRPWATGVALYLKHGKNLMLRKTFMRRPETADLKATLVEELRKLAGLSTAEFKALKREAAAPKPPTMPEIKEPARKDPDDELMELAHSLGVTVDELFTDEFRDRVLYSEENEDRIYELEEQLEEAEEKYKAISQPVAKMIRFRERFTFLNEPDCPDILKILVADMFTALGKYKEAHAALVDLPDDAALQKAAELAEKTVENYLANREIWEELEYYRENRELLGKCEKVKAMKEAQELEKASDLELSRLMNSAAANTSKQKARLKEAQAEKNQEKIEAATAALATWEAKKTAVKAELEKRKKN